METPTDEEAEKAVKGQKKKDIRIQRQKQKKWYNKTNKLFFKERCWGGHIFINQIEFFSVQYRVIAVDTRGHIDKQ